MRPNSKNTIIEAGAAVIHQKGFNHAGLSEILKAAGLPKGSFYNHFKSKEEFGLQVIDYFGEVFEQHTRTLFEDSPAPPLKRLAKLLDFYIDYFSSTAFTCGCPVGNLAQEMGDLSEAFQNRLNQAIDDMAGTYAELLAEAQANGDIPGGMDVKETAYFIIAGWHGALIRMKVTRDDKPLKNHKHFVLNHVLAP